MVRLILSANRSGLEGRDGEELPLLLGADSYVLPSRDGEHV